ncbi:hypothetical protein [Methylorubrum sp. POS3]|uniref:hypothetical protein n=1 Tax=Methylorubrum sp. POS3 TaxID=2998492 RepID=UPI003727B040
MEHYKSTLGVTAAAISALVLAAQIMHAGPFAASTPRPERAVASLDTQAEQTAWVNPPMRQQSVPATEVAQTRPETVGAKPAEVSVPPAQSMSQALAPVAAQKLERDVPSAARKSASAQRRKAAQRPVRSRHATLESQEAATNAASPPSVPAQAPTETKRVDPIGDIIRGLGFGGQG